MTRRPARTKVSHTNFVILFLGREGSSQLATMLNSHPRAVCFPEVLVDMPEHKKLAIAKGIAKGADIYDLNGYVADSAYYESDYWIKFAGGPFDAYGFKTKFMHCGETPAFTKVLVDNSFHVIHLSRNAVTAVVSALNSLRLYDAHGTWNAQSSKQVMGPLHIDTTRMLELLDRRVEDVQSSREFLQNLPLKMLRTTYEDLFQSDDTEIQHIQRFLGIEPLGLKGTFIRNTPHSLKEAILNYNEVKAALAGTRHEQAFWLASQSTGGAVRRGHRRGPAADHATRQTSSGPDHRREPAAGDANGRKAPSSDTGHHQGPAVRPVARRLGRKDHGSRTP
jgi:hypothetical protein